jgi:hypothetical protein
LGYAPVAHGQPTPSPEGSRSALPAVVSFLLGVLGCVVPLLPMLPRLWLQLEGLRGYLALVFALPGFALAIVGLRGRRYGQLLAVFGAIFSVLALIMGLAMIIGPILNA